MRIITSSLLLTALTLGCGAPPPASDTGPGAAVSSSSRFLKAAEPIRNQYIVVLADPPAHAPSTSVPALASALAARHGGTILHVYERALRGFAVRMSEPQALALAKDPSVAYVEEDGVVRLANEPLPALPIDTSVGASYIQEGAPWHLDRLDQRARPLDGNYTYFNTAATVHAYVIDSGIRTTHTEFGGRATADYSAINDGRGATDCHGHGTHTAGVIGGALYGVAKNVRLHSVRVLDCNGGGAYSGIIAGVDWVTWNHIKPAVANMSLHGGANSSLDFAVRNSIAQGVTYVVASGTGPTNACNVSPARVTEAITVAASTSSDASWSPTNTGSCVDLYAPGLDIYSAWNSSDTAIYNYGGSTSSAHVAGAVAQYLEVDPNATPAAVGSAILSHATAGAISPAPPTGTPNRLLYTSFIGTRLTKGVTHNALTHYQGEARYFSLYVPAGQTRLQFDTSGGTGDVDLYVRQGLLPTTGTFDCKAATTGTRETCIINNPAPGYWFVMMHAFGHYANVALAGSYL